MGLQEKINEAVEPAVEKARNEAVEDVLNSISVEYENKFDKILHEVYGTKDLRLIGELNDKVDELDRYMKARLNGENPIESEYAKRIRQRNAKKKVLIDILNEYTPGVLIPGEELAKKTGFSQRDLSNYTKGRNPFLTKGEGGYYRPEKIPEGELYREYAQRLRLEKEKLVSVIRDYPPGSIIAGDELSEKTGLTTTQLNCYARGGKSLLLKTGDGNYKVNYKLDVQKKK